ncbi:MAG TPA: ABC transporter permease [Xanthobacteraceae bacterium]|nr:ABC transporter permease [Xanthobacteraceae bacterium]
MSGLVQIVIGGLLQGGVFAIVALGFSLVYRVTNVVNLAQGAFCVLGAMGMYYFQVEFGWPILPAALAAVAASTAFALIVGAVTFVPAVSRLPASSALVLTAGLLTFFVGVTLVVWGNQPYSLPPFSGEAPVVLGGLRLPTQGLWLAAIAAAMIAGLWLLLQRTTLGRALRACAENPVAARLMGIDLPRMMLLSFALAALIGAAGGVLVAPIMSLQFDSGQFFTISGFIAVAIGGMGSFAGSIVGGLLLGIAEQFAAFYVSSLFANTLALLLLLIVLILRPSGLFASGPARRSDVRDDARIHRPVVRLRGRAAIGFAVALVAILALLPFLPLPGGLLASLVIALILFIAVLGLDVLMGYAGQVSLGHAGFMAVGGYAAAILATSYDWPPLAATLVALVLSVACALVLAAATRQLRGHYLALATLAFGLLIDSLAVGLFDLTGGPSGLVGIPAFTAAGLAFDTPQRMYYLALALSVVLVVMLEGGMRMGFGRALKAVRSDQLAAAALGVNVGRVKVVALCISAALASLSGSLYAFNFHFLSPEIVSTSRSFEMIAMLVLGGEGTLIGGFFGSLVLTLLPTLVQDFAVFKTAVEGAILVVIFLAMPEGLFGRVAIWLERGVVRMPRLRTGVAP